MAIWTLFFNTFSWFEKIGKLGLYSKIIFELVPDKIVFTKLVPKYSKIIVPESCTPLSKDNILDSYNPLFIAKSNVFFGAKQSNA